MKRIFLIGGVILVSFISGFGQNKFQRWLPGKQVNTMHQWLTPSESALRLTNYMIKEIGGLTRKQIAQLESINLRYMQSMDSLPMYRDNATLIKQKKEIAMEGQDARFRQVLISQQYQEWIYKKKHYVKS